MATKLATTVAVKTIASQRWIWRIHWFQLNGTSSRDKLERAGRRSCRRLLPALQLGDLDDVAASVVHLGDGRSRHLGRRHDEGAAARADRLVVALDVVGEEHDRGPALLEQGLLVGLRRRVVVE